MYSTSSSSVAAPARAHAQQRDLGSLARHIAGAWAGPTSWPHSASRWSADLPGVGREAETALHPSCTCRMGVGADSVVDPRSMRVHGVSGLRVVDASAMPYVTNGNIYAAVMMLAEKSADLILGNTPAPAAATEFYRHGV